MIPPVRCASRCGRACPAPMRVILVGDGAPDLQEFSRPVLRARLEADTTSVRAKERFCLCRDRAAEKFIASLEQGGAEVTGSCFFADHHPYTDDEILQLKAIAGDALLVTTEKDFVRLSVTQREGIRAIKAVAVFDDPAGLDRLLDRAWGPV